MKIKDNIYPLSYFKTNAEDILAQVSEMQKPVFFKQDCEIKGVILDIHSYQSMKNVLSTLKHITKAEKDIIAGSVIDQDSVFSTIENRFIASSGFRHYAMLRPECQ